MNSDLSNRADGETGFAPWLKLAEVAWGAWFALWRTVLLGLIIFALWGITVGPNLSFPQGVRRNPLAVDGTQAARAAIRNSSVNATSIQMDVDRVTVPVTVTDRDGYILTDLKKDNFEVYDDKVKQHILAFSSEDAPLAAGIIFDTSRSMEDKLQNSKDAALQFCKTANPEDLFMLVAFNSRPYMVSDVTGDYAKLLAEMLFAQSEGTTSLMDAIYAGIAKLRPLKVSRKVLLVISDGGENHSRYTYGTIRKMVREANVQIYTIGIFESADDRDLTPEEEYGPALLADLARISGGRAYSMGSSDELPGVMEEISLSLRSQYVIAYKPSNLVRDGRWRRIKVRLRPPSGLTHLHAYARSGYYAPTR